MSNVQLLHLNLTLGFRTGSLSLARAHRPARRRYRSFSETLASAFPITEGWQPLLSLRAEDEFSCQMVWVAVEGVTFPAFVNFLLIVRGADFYDDHPPTIRVERSLGNLYDSEHQKLF